MTPCYNADMNSLYDVASRCLSAGDPDSKCQLTHALFLGYDKLSRPTDRNQIVPLNEPGRPQRLELVAPRFLKRRRLGTREGMAVLLHALTHIEFNAINLALDAVYRFRGMPDAFYHDWVRIADEEATHFLLLRNHLRFLGYDYGDFPAHDGLWDMAVRTAVDVEARMALVPRCLEARGLDVTPGIREKLFNAGDRAAAVILDCILRDEIGHVSVGDRWFKYVCRQRKNDPESRFYQLLEEYFIGQIKGPYHVAARRQAGFSDTEIEYLQQRYG
jgi:uncharacterized ferritin-like protein (DUF455 family)